jgi:hypothetical protein
MIEVDSFILCVGEGSKEFENFLYLKIRFF